MRILLFAPVIGGHQPVVVSFLWRYWAEQGDDVTFVSWKDEAIVHQSGLQLPDLRFIAGPSDPGFEGSGARRSFQIYRALQQCLRWADEERADVFHLLTLDYSEIPLLAAIRKARRRGRIDTKIFGTMNWIWYGDAIRAYPWPKRLFFEVNRRALRRLLSGGDVRSVVVHTDEQKAAIVAAMGAPSVASQVSVVPNPTEAPPPISKQEARGRLGLPQNTTVFLFFGALRWDKGPDIFLEALRAVRGDWTAVLAGAPKAFGTEDVEMWRSRLDAPNRLVARLEYIPTEDMHDYFAAADAVVLPYRRVFGGDSGVLQRAAENATPVIATDAGVVGAIVRREGLGIVVEPESPDRLAEAIQTFLDDPALARDIEPRARDYARRSDWRVAGATFRQMYEGRPLSHESD
ncbi:MAG: glycosyltransferase family 4 protein [Actinomycetota bacterium]